MPAIHDAYDILNLNFRFSLSWSGFVSIYRWLDDSCRCNLWDLCPVDTKIFLNQFMSSHCFKKLSSQQDGSVWGQLELSKTDRWMATTDILWTSNNVSFNLINDSLFLLMQMKTTEKILTFYEAFSVFKWVILILYCPLLYFKSWPFQKYLKISQPIELKKSFLIFLIFLVYFGYFWILLDPFGIFWNVSEAYDTYWNLWNLSNRFWTFQILYEPFGSY